jgi:phosphohistidine swiveling domain-containing protein
MDRWITDWPIGERFRHFTRANAGEVIATPASPLGQEYSWDHAMILGWRDGYVRQGSYDADEFDPDHPETSGFFGGYFYINLSNVRMQGARSPILTVEQLDLAFFGDHPDVPPYVAHPADDRPDLEPGIMAHLGWVMSTTVWPEIDEEKAAVAELRAGRPDLTTLSDAELVARAREIQPLLRKLFDSHTVTSSSSGVAPGILFAVGEAIGDPTVPMKLVAGIGDVDSAEPSYAMWDLSRLIRSSDELTSIFDAGVDGVLARLRASDSVEAADFLAGFDRFLFEHGSRGPNEWELSAEVWETRPTLALSMIDRVRMQSDEESPRKRNAAKAAEREAVTAQVRERVGALDPELAAQFEGAMIAANMLAFRERTKTTNIRALHEARQTFRELARRHVESGDLRDVRHLFMLRDEEVEQFVADPAAFTDTLAERYQQWITLWDLEPPFFIVDGEVPPISTWPRRGEAPVARCGVGDSIQGVPGCAGVARGRARVILDPSDPGLMEAGDVLIAPSTDPAWTPLFMPASAVVVDVGGQISHSIIVSRELGLPCVVSATDATRRIPDGATVEVDGSAGTITVVGLPT